MTSKTSLRKLLIISEIFIFGSLSAISVIDPKTFSNIFFLSIPFCISLIVLHLFSILRAPFLLIFFSLGLCWGFIELGFWGYEKNVPLIDHKFSSSKHCMQRDVDTIAWGKPFCQTSVSEEIDSQFVYQNISYAFDKLGRRGCPQTNSPTDRHALFFGCSYTFGEGVTAEKNLPCAFQRISGFHSYNYGQNGFGTGEMYSIIHQPRFFEDEIPRTGIAVYNFIWDHVPRSIGSLEHLTSGSFYPNPKLFSFDEKTGVMNVFRPSDSFFLRHIISALSSGRLVSPTVRYIGGRTAFQFQPDEAAIRTIVELIASTREAYLQKYQGRFFVLLWPRGGPSEYSKKLFFKLLGEKNIQVLQPPQLPPEFGKPQLHPLDPHPSEQEDEWIAQWLSEAISIARR